MSAGALVMLMASCGDGLTPEARAEQKRMSQLSEAYSRELGVLDPGKIVVTYESSVNALDPKERDEMIEFIRLAGQLGIPVERGRRSEMLENLTLGDPPTDYLTWVPTDGDVVDLQGKLVLVVNFGVQIKPATVRHSRAKEADIRVLVWNPVYDREKLRRRSQ